MSDPQRVAVLAREKFPDRAKTATGVLKYADYDMVVVLDRDSPGTTAADYHRDLPDVPVVASMADAPDTDILLIGISPVGDAFDETWYDDIRTALERGCDLIPDLHYFLAEDEEFARLADGHGCDINDIRKPYSDLGVA